VNETLRMVDGRAVLRIERRLAHPPAKVWRALTEPGELSQWFPATVSMDLRVGAEIQFEFGGGRILELDPPRVFAFSWDDSLLRFELRPDGDGCLLVFTHTFDDRAGAASFAAGWRRCLDAMERLLAGEPVAHVRPPAELHDAYLDAFGLDTGEVEQTGDGWRVRFERQLTQPAGAAWAALTAAPPRVGAPPPAGFTTGLVRPGAVTAVTAPRLLEYEWLQADRPVGRVRWELSDQRGTGHGARLLLTQTGPAELADQRATALSAWRHHLCGVARQLRTGATGPASDPALGTLCRTGDGRLVLRFERRLAHPPERVWRALTERDQLRQWFPVHVDVDLSCGAGLRFDLTAEAKRRLALADQDTTSTGEVTRFDPPRLLEYTWGEETTRWELTPDGAGGCRLVFTDFFDGDLDQPDHRDAAAQASAAWHACLDLLAARLSDQQVDWSTWDRAAGLNDDYLAVARSAVRV
jgi:uncharacterized protein YndB with AHSA1/START domain